jgi:hypothetical protein
MAKPIPAAEREESVERLKLFLRYMETRPGKGTTQTALARALDLTTAAFTKAKERGVGDALRVRLDDMLGLRRIYWTSPTRLDPDECMRPSARDVSRVETEVALMRENIRQIAVERGESHDVLGALAAEKPPKGHEADPWWWFRTYLRLSDGKQRRARHAP